MVTATMAKTVLQIQIPFARSLTFAATPFVCLLLDGLDQDAIWMEHARTQEK